MRLLAFRSLVVENCRWRIEELTIAEFLQLLEARKTLAIGWMPMIGFCRWVERERVEYGTDISAGFRTLGVPP
jgi:hypothetical protein